MVERNRAYHRTQIAKFGADIAVVFAAKFYQSQINGYQPILRDPPGGVSTGGGRQPLQHLILQPTGGTGSVITIGSVNMVDRSAKVRSYDCVERMAAQRFEGRAVPVQAAAYGELLQRIIEFLQKQGIEVEVVEVPPAMPPSMRRPSVRPSAPESPWGRWLLAFVVTASLAAAAVWLITK